MGAFESKRWSELPPETPQKVESLEDGMDDPRSPSIQYSRTPILLKEYDESPQNLIARAEFQDPRSPSMKITRTPINVSKTGQENEEEDVLFDVFNAEAKHIDGVSNLAFDPQNSPAVPLRRKDKLGLKNTSSPGDFRRKNRLSRRQSFPQKLFSEKESSLPRSPLAQRNHSVPDDNSVMSGRNKKFSFVHKKKGFISEDLIADKENSVEQVLL